jgi:hypothetical protein
MLKKQLFTHASWLRMHWFKAMRAFAAVPLGSTTDLQPLPTHRTTWHLPTPSRALLHETDVDPAADAMPDGCRSKHSAAAANM